VRSLGVASLVLLLLVGCRRDEGGVTAPTTLGGRSVSARVLAQGRVAYLQYCRACHGDQGDGRGPAAVGMRPPPRDFTQGMFKFGWVLEQKLPRDEDLVRLVRSNLHGSSMVGWDVPEPQLEAVVQYIKTFSDVWRQEGAVGEPVVLAPDPWAGREHAAVARGERLYHGFAQCLSCHPAYLPEAQIDAASRALSGHPATGLRPAPYQPRLLESDYAVGDLKVQILAPDFLVNALRSPRPGSELADLYRVLVAGVTGAAMPAWDPSLLPEKTDDVWALAYYVRSLARLRGTTAGLALRARLNAAHAPGDPR
jgi:mono/diheme cytochrome c family protein